jgi:hypothetical protein
VDLLKRLDRMRESPDAKTGPVVCEYWFYVPAGDATGQVVFGYWVGGTKYYYTLNENPVNGSDLRRADVHSDPERR